MKLFALSIALIFVASGCGITDSCDEETKVHESLFIDGEEFFGEDIAEIGGWDCRFDGSVRDGFGRVVANRYACERCV